MKQKCIFYGGFAPIAILRLIGPQTKRAAAGRLHPGYSGGPGTLPPQNGQAGVHISRPPKSGSDKQATNEQRELCPKSGACHVDHLVAPPVERGAQELHRGLPVKSAFPFITITDAKRE